MFTFGLEKRPPHFEILFLVPTIEETASEGLPSSCRYEQIPQIISLITIAGVHLLILKE